MLDSNVDEMENMVELNITALLRLTKAIPPGFLERKGGAIINIASIAALHPELLNGVYSGITAFVVKPDAVASQGSYRQGHSLSVTATKIRI